MRKSRILRQGKAISAADFAAPSIAASREFSLTAIAYNLRLVLNIVRFGELMAAVQG